ncbi:MAG: flagellar basal body L-ring protein FlgH [Epsilonproteobacteria bacterium]|nr:flagellar biosynthesis protein FlgH [Campylobacterota bacterium]NPA57384.1 flagellar basal body L-ring protein FlgH [Campylobacterota bacterium]
MQSYLLRLGILSALILLLGGCGQKRRPPEPPKELTPPKLGEIEAPRSPGSLYSGYDNLFSDAKAYNVGDILTIRVVENVRGSGSTDTKTSRSHKMNLDFPSPTVGNRKVFNREKLFGFDQQSSNTFQGKGGTNRSARLIATITARVVKVYPNGNLFIVGKKYITINSDTQILRISGIVNPAYIEADNSIDSSRIGDMYVEYRGKGFMNQTQEPGWLANLLMKIWPF